MSPEDQKPPAGPPEFVAEINSDAQKAPVRLAFLTRRTSPQVRSEQDDYIFTYPEAFYAVAIAVETLFLVLVWVALLWDAPLEELADPMHTPNPAKAPWYFLGLQELLHYFPPFVAGVLIPTLVILALVVIPYFNINIEAAGLFTKDRKHRVRIFSIVAITLVVFLAGFQVWVSLVPTLVIACLMALAALGEPDSSQRARAWLFCRPLSFWLMTWFLIQAVVLTVVGTFFRGPGWSWVLPWRVP